MRISDWSSDVCSSDLCRHRVPLQQISLQRAIGNTSFLREALHGHAMSGHGGPDTTCHGRVDRKSTRLNSSHKCASRMPSSSRKQKITTQMINNRTMNQKPIYTLYRRSVTFT